MSPIVKIKGLLTFFTCRCKDPDLDPYKIMTDPVSEGPKTYESYGSGPTTLAEIHDRELDWEICWKLEDNAR
jgi:hypothetical protein